MLPQKLIGSFVAIVTPFNEDGTVDEAAYRNLLKWHVTSGTNGIVACGTTGEAATLTQEEKELVIKIAIEECKERPSGASLSRPPPPGDGPGPPDTGTSPEFSITPWRDLAAARPTGKIPVIGGIAANNTVEAVRQAQWIKNLGVDATLVLSPYYNKPPNEGLFQHFKAVAEVGNPIIVYNVPGRTGSNVTPEVVLRLAREVPGIAAVKEASGNVGQIMDLLREVARGTQDWKSPNFVVLLGDDALTFPLLPLGATGCISVVANETPKEFADMISAALSGDIAGAAKLHFQLLKLMNINFIETNPLPVKTALSLMGKVKPVFRLPLVPMQAGNVEKLKAALAELKLV